MDDKNIHDMPLTLDDGDDLTGLTRFLPDPHRARHGLWMLDSHLLPRVEQLRAEEPSRSTQQCWELAGAQWVPDGLFMIFGGRDEYENPWRHVMQHLFLDPQKTKVERTEEGVDVWGSWNMTMRQRDQVDILKLVHPKWSWGQCFKKAGGRWCAISE